MSDSEEEEDGEQWAVPLETSAASLNRSLSETPEKPCDTRGTSTTSDLEVAAGSFGSLYDPQQDVGTSSISEPLYGHTRTIVQIDIDCFYAQVEMIRHPELRDKPLGIQQKYIVVTCNYKAREFGVTKLMSIKDAREKCPQLILVRGEDLTHYRAMSYRITEQLQKFSPVVERLGFDENFLDITSLVKSRLANGHPDTSVEGFVYQPQGLENTDSQPRKENTCGCGCHTRLAIGSQIAAEIRKALVDELGITSCAGIAHNKLLAKLVGSTHKPNKQTTLLPGDAHSFMVSLQSVRKIPGIGYSSVKKLAGIGVVSVTDLQNCSLDTLQSEFDEAQCWKMKQLSHGIDESVVKLTGQPQSISDEDSFKKCSTEREAKEKILELLNNLLIRLHEDGRIPQTIRLTIRKFSTVNKYTNRESRQCAIPNHLFSQFSPECFPRLKAKLCDLLMPLFHKLVDVKCPFHLTLINVCFAKLGETAKNKISSFFGQPGGSNVKSTAREKYPDETHALWSGDKLTQELKKEDSHVSNEISYGGESHVTGTKGATIEDVSRCQKNRKRLFFPTADGFPEKKAKLVDKAENRVPYSSGGTDLRIGDSDNKDSAGGMIPAGVDEDFFNALPMDIQAELRQQVVVKDSKPIVKKRNSCRSSSTGGSKHVNHSTGQQKMDNFCRSGRNEITSSKLSENRTMSETLCENNNECLSKQMPWQPTSNVSFSAESATTSHSPPEELSFLDIKPGKNDSEASCGKTVHLPPDIDREMFMSLPADVQKELLLQWKEKNSHVLTSPDIVLVKSTSQKGTENSQRKKSSPGILKYYQKKT